jgi:hypothetical protein
MLFNIETILPRMIALTLHLEKEKLSGPGEYCTFGMK